MTLCVSLPVCLSAVSFQQYALSFEWNVKIPKPDQVYLGKHALQTYQQKEGRSDH